MRHQLAGIDVVIIGSFLLAFKAVLIEGSEVAILSLATIKQIGRRNVLLGVVLGGLGSIVTFLIVEQAFLALKTVSDALINLIPGVVSSTFPIGFCEDLSSIISVANRSGQRWKNGATKSLRKTGST